MHSFFRKTFSISGIVVFITAVPVFVFAQEVGGIYGALGLPAASNALLVMRIMQFLWFFIAALSLGFAGYGFYLRRSAPNDLLQMDRGGRYMRYGFIVGGISLVVGIILTVVFIQMTARTSVPTPISTPAGSETQGFSTLFLGASSKIVSHFPGRDEKNVARNVSLLITFSDAVDVKSVASDAGELLTDKITVRTLDGGAAVVGNVELDASKKILKITPSQLLGDASKNVTYQASISSAVLFENGQSVLGGTGSYTWQFEVANRVDTTPPFVEGVFPVSARSGDRIATNALIQVQFSESVDPSLLTGGKIEVLRQGVNTPIEGTFYLASGYRILTFIPKELCGVNSCNVSMYCLPKNTPIRVVLKAATLAQPRNPDNFNKSKFPYDGIADMAGNSFDGGGERGAKHDQKSDGRSVDDYYWSFTTSDSVNKEVPRITALNPGRDGRKVSLTDPVRLEFSHLMDASSLTPSTVVLGSDLNYWVSAKNDYQKNITTVEIAHDVFKQNTLYRPEVSSEARSLYQQCFSSCSGPVQ